MDLHKIWQRYIGVADLITWNKFFGYRLRGVDSVGDQNLSYFIYKPSTTTVNTRLAQRAPVI